MKYKLFIVLHLSLIFSFQISFAQNSTVSTGNWLNNARWSTSPYPSATDCYTPITISHQIGIQNTQDVDLSGCGAVEIIVNAGGLLRFGDSAGSGATLTLASGSTITVTGGGTITNAGSGTGANATIIIGGNEVWDGSDADITGEGTVDENSTDGSLPVVLVDFTGDYVDGTISLNWITSSELNNDGFFIEMSNNTQDFETIGWVEGNGTVNETNTYTFKTDKTRSNQYFRLKQVDYDGQFEYHKTIFVRANGEQMIEIYPNPTSESISIMGHQGEVYYASLIDAMGHKVIPSKSTDLYLLEDEINQLIGSLEPGVYVINLASDTGVTTKRLVIQ